MAGFGTKEVLADRETAEPTGTLEPRQRCQRTLRGGRLAQLRREFK